MVISDDDRIDGRYLEVQQGILSLLALQAPVAGDLRIVAALLHAMKNIERMGDQCVNMAKLVPLAGHEPPEDARVLDNIARMGAQARAQVVQCKQAFERRDVALAEDLVRQDDEIDRLNREVFGLALEIGDDPDTREWAMHMMLIARCIERIGDNAVDIGEQTAFVVTGLFREFEDASHPELAPTVRHLICACIDIGSNTTRLLVADAGDGQLRELVTQRAFTRIGKSLGHGGAIPAEKIAETAEVVATQTKVAREVGADQIVAVATAAIRNAPNRADLVSAVHDAGGMELDVLSGEEEARLSFVGATRTLVQPAEGTIAVVDVGGGSSEIAVGEADGAMGWSASFRIGSGFLADAYLRSDPPSVEELEKVRRHVAGTFEGLEPPPAQSAVAVGGTATSLRRLLGAELVHETLERGIRVLSSTPIDDVAARFELDRERVRLLPAGILVLEAVSDLLELPLRIARGGLREGVLLELVEGRKLA